MLIMRGTVAVVVIFIQAFQGLAADDSKFVLVNNLGLCLVRNSYRCIEVRWTTNDRLFVPGVRKCLGVQGKTLGSEVSLYDCDETSDLQKWECKNGTLLALQHQGLYVNLTGYGSGVLSKVVGPNTHLTIQGQSEGACSRTNRELFTIEGNAFGRPCMFPFFYKDKWFEDCTVFDSSVKRLWCAVETKYDHELWGYCPSTSTDHWKKHPVTGVYYQINRQSVLSWFQAQTSCKQQGASLLSITDPHEQAYVTALLGSEHYILWTGLNLNPDHGWGWADGKPFRYLQWDSDNPLPDPGHTCAMIDSGVQSNWKSAVCSKKLGYICQKGGSLPPPIEVETGHCSSPWIPYNGQCFHLMREKKTWSDAQTECRKEGGDLASVHNIEDHSFVISQLGYASSDELWIGLNDKKTERLFDWTDHSTVTYTSWEFGEPNTSGDTEDCVLMRGEKGNWADRSCEEKHGFFCRKPSATKPTQDEVELNVGCKPGWKRHGSYCYLVGSVTKTFDEAKAECKSSDSYMVDVSNGVDNAFLVSLVGMRPEKYFWLGLSNQKNIDYFEWSNKATVRFTHWNALMPGHQQGCVAMLTGIFAGLWDILPCNNKEKYICKHLAEGGVLTPPPPTQAVPSCTEGWKPVATRPFCYKFFTGPRSGEKTWYDAKDYCRAIGGDLLSLHSSSDLGMGRHGKAWIGLNAPDETTGYVWSDGSPVNFLSWGSGEPNNLNNVETCVEFKKASEWDEEGSWNDVHCESFNDWLCQIRAGVTPKPPPSDPAKEYNETVDGWLVWRGNQYYINLDSMAREDARHYCQKNHGDLVIINSEAESVFLWKQVSRRYGQYYIGMTADLDGSFEWLDGSPVVFLRWGENQPDFLNSDENCVAMNHYNGFWSDYNCGVEHKSICKRSASPPVNTTVAPTVAPTGGCPSKWTKFGSKCYQIVQNRKDTWAEARTQCKKGGNLVSILSRPEQAFLVIQMATAAAPDLWIGLNSLRGDEFYWTDGRPRKYSNRGSSVTKRPIHHFLRRFSEDQCAVLNSNASQGFGKWILKSCNDTNGYVCMRNVDQGLPVVPEPETNNYVTLYNDSIKVLTQNVTWDQAKKLCEADGAAQLASIRNTWSQAYVELQALNLNTPLWIGLNTMETGGYFRFIDGWHLIITFWARNEPSSGQPCVYVDVDGKWKTALCNQTMNSVCMKTTDVPPTVSDVQYPGGCPDHTIKIQHSYMTSDSDENVAWVPFRDHCYLFMTAEIEWPDAASSCVRLGGVLASIGDPDEQSFIKNKVEMLKDSHSAFWIGLYKTHKGTWLWLDKTPMDYVNWGHFEPDDDTYGTIHSEDGTWKTGRRWHDRSYICETPKEITEQLPTVAAHKQEGAHQRHRVHSALVVVLVLTVLSVVTVTAFLLYKKSGRPLPTFDNPLYFNRERSQPDVIDTNKLIEKAEVENPEPIITL